MRSHGPVSWQRSRSRRGHVVAAVSACAASVAAGVCSAAVGSTGLTVPAADSFSGHITLAAGEFTDERGQATILLEPDHSGAATPQLTLVLDGRRCGKAKHCIRLIGELTGTLIARPTIPDAGPSFTIDASGMIQPLGQVSATGSVRGTGFVVYGYERLHLTLSMPAGFVVLHARSGRVPGFTSP